MPLIHARTGAFNPTPMCGARMYHGIVVRKVSEANCPECLARKAKVARLNHIRYRHLLMVIGQRTVYDALT